MGIEIMCSPIAGNPSCDDYADDSVVMRARMTQIQENIRDAFEFILLI